jgi:hypothetical protein
METCAGSHTKKYDQELLQCEILFEFIWWAVAAILFLFLRIIFDVDAQFHTLFFYPRIMRSSLLLRVGCFTDIEVKGQEGCM